MNKKVILLMLALPLILMLSLFTATNTVSLVVPIPVSGIEIHEDPIVYVDLNETYDISYTVYPTNAANQTVTYTSTPVGDDTFAKLTFEDGKIIPESCGKATVTIRTVDGGYDDSFIVSVFTDTLQSIDSTLNLSEIELGETAQITTEFTPSNTPYNQRGLGYAIVQGQDIVSINAVGKVTGIGVGTATIRAYCLVNEEIFDEVEIAVKNSAPVQFNAKSVTNTVLQAGGSVGLFINNEVVLDSAPMIEALDEDGQPSDVITYTLDMENKEVAYTFNDENVCTVTLRIQSYVEGQEYVSECVIERISKIKAEWVNGDVNGVIIAPGGVTELKFEITPSNVQVTYEISLSTTVHLSYDAKEIASGTIKITANADEVNSETILTLKITDADGNEVVLEQTFIVFCQ